MLEFSLWAYVSRLTQMFVLQADKVLIGRFAGPAFLPVYSVPFGFAQKINFLAGPAVTAIYPTAAAEQNDPELFMGKYFSASRLVHMLTGAAALSVLFWGEKFLAAWIGPEFAHRSVFYLYAFTVGYWMISVGSFDMGCLEGWNRPRTNLIISGAGLFLAVSVGVFAWPPMGASRAIALSVTTWLVSVGIGGIIVWQRISRHPIEKFIKRIALPLVEMGLIGIVFSVAMGTFTIHRYMVIAVLPAFAIGLAAYGCNRSFSREEIRAIYSRLTSFMGSRG
jgi:O-antigen/teichoic acid export membrane protein